MECRNSNALGFRTEQSRSVINSFGFRKRPITEGFRSVFGRFCCLKSEHDLFEHSILTKLDHFIYIYIYIYFKRSSLALNKKKSGPNDRNPNYDLFEQSIIRILA